MPIFRGLDGHTALYPSYPRPRSSGCSPDGKTIPKQVTGLKEKAGRLPGTLPCGASLAWFAVIAVAGFAHLLPDAAREWLLYDRRAIAVGQLWRLVSGHFLHTNLNHLLMNGAALFILFCMFGPRLGALKSVGLLLLLCALCGAGLFVFAGGLQRYVGLSGVLHGLIVWGSIADIRRGERLGLVLLLGAVAKIAWEQLGGDTGATAALIDAEVAIAAHLWGALAGLLVSLPAVLGALVERLFMQRSA